LEKRTDLAVECYEESKKTEISGVKVVDENGVTTVSKAGRDLYNG